jgi:hypothetical protein
MRKSRREWEEKEKEKLFGTKPNSYLPHMLPHPRQPLVNERPTLHLRTLINRFFNIIYIY